ncbi:MAG: pseudouridine synthase [Ignavibacteriales bacterium]|nr:pseudouridine synthase [Ignavibacteriales bacterium]
MPGRKHDVNNHTYIIFYKPYGVLSQFTDSAGRKTLSDFGPFPKDVYPVGRLDADSEGLLLLTDDTNAKHHLLEPGFDHTRTYLVQVERIPTREQLAKLESGVVIEGKKTKVATVVKLEQEPQLPPREVPIRFRKNVATSWLEITLTEGRNRQVRKMTAAVGHPTLRLFRVAQEGLTLAGLQPGKHRRLTKTEASLLLDSLGSSPHS